MKWRKWQRRLASTYFIDSQKKNRLVSCSGLTNTTNTPEARYPWRPLATSLLCYSLLPSCTSRPSPKRGTLLFLNHPSHQHRTRFLFSLCLSLIVSIFLPPFPYLSLCVLLSLFSFVFSVKRRFKISLFRMALQFSFPSSLLFMPCTSPSLSLFASFPLYLPFPCVPSPSRCYTRSLHLHPLPFTC